MVDSSKYTQVQTRAQTQQTERKLSIFLTQQTSSYRPRHSPFTVIRKRIPTTDLSMTTWIKKLTRRTLPLKLPYQSRREGKNNCAGATNTVDHWRH
ncbi:hypothetical protein I7I53_00038 [Histoplasma capsulatum var. duboisii H88]|uniref:Uncharacterized protein n=1 Tax=Ajellomyces capsulatus (strain H88) TaxID=544711 RepID=A0A8A1LHF7_AJEC8|nr:hypothetical protein I7I53_00038 [Histoplasma capsulatum var. duboisii H88]